MNPQTLKKAMESIKIGDVYLRSIQALSNEGFDPKYFQNYDDLSVQFKHHVDRSEVVKLNGDEQILRVFVDFGVRWVNDKDIVDNKDALAFIEATFIAEYLMTAPVEQTDIDEFALKNASFHVWPFWRELVMSTCTRLQLPKVAIPLIQLATNRDTNEQ